MPGAGSQLTTSSPGLAQAAGDVAAAGRDVERGAGAGRPLDEQVEVGPFAVGVARAVQLGPLAPDVGHAASSTARCAASSIVGDDVQVRRRGLGEDPPALLGVRAVEADDDRQLEPHLARAPAGSRARPRRSA